MTHTVIASDPHNPGAELRRVSQRPYAGQSPEHSVLRDVFGVVNIAEHPETRYEDALVVPVRKSLVGLFVSRARAINKLFVSNTNTETSERNQLVSIFLLVSWFSTMT